MIRRKEIESYASDLSKPWIKNFAWKAVSDFSHKAPHDVLNEAIAYHHTMITDWVSNVSYIDTIEACDPARLMKLLNPIFGESYESLNSLTLKGYFNVNEDNQWDIDEVENEIFELDALGAQVRGYHAELTGHFDDRDDN